MIAATGFYFVYERVAPDRQLPESPGWYWRAGLMNLAQLDLIGLSGVILKRCFREYALLPIGCWSNPAAEGAFSWPGPDVPGVMVSRPVGDCTSAGRFRMRRLNWRKPEPSAVLLRLGMVDKRHRAATASASAACFRTGGWTVPGCRAHR